MHPKVQSVIRHPYTIPVVAGAGGAVAGFTLGYFVARKFILKKMMKAADEMAAEVGEMLEQIEEQTSALERNQMKLDLNSPEALEQIKLYEISDEGVTVVPIKDVQLHHLSLNTDGSGHPVNVIEPDPEPVLVTRDALNDPADEGWDWDAELAARKELGHLDPYVIHRNEFFGDETEWDNQQQFTWYEVDNVLANDDEQPVYNWIFMTGDLKFGHGSGDPDVVYVRNPRMHAEYEITRLHKSYAIDVAADKISEEFEAQDIKHSSRPGKFRPE